MDFLLALGMLSPPVAILAIPTVYLWHRIKFGLPGFGAFVGLLFSALFVGVLAGIVGLIVGGLVYCTFNVSEMCGAAGIATGPLAFSIAVGIVLYRWVNRMRQSTQAPQSGQALGGPPAGL